MGEKTPLMGSGVQWQWWERPSDAFRFDLCPFSSCDYSDTATTELHKISP